MDIKSALGLLGILAMVSSASPSPGRERKFELLSPDGGLRVHIEVGERIAYSVAYRGRDIIVPSRISMTLQDGEILGAAPVIMTTRRRSVDDVIRPPIREKREVIPDIFNEISFVFRESFGLVFRAYDDGFAYRFGLGRKSKVKVYSEEVSFRFAGDFPVVLPVVEGFHSSFERPYLRIPLSRVTKDRMAYLPLVADIEGGPKVALTEVDLDDYPGMYLRGSEDGSPSLVGVFPPFPLKEEQTRDRTVKVVKTADYIAETSAPREFPWRAAIIVPDDAGLILSDLVYRLAGPCRIPDTSWIKPGKVAWDWWNANNLYGVDFEAGINTETYKDYIDFAERFGIPYIILDEGWSEPSDLFKVNPRIDLEALVDYGRARGVGLILWCVWLTLERQMQPALDLFRKWGVSGIKVDFMDRDDQRLVNFYRRTAEEAAARKLVVDFHGSFKPTGLRRAFPNILTREGVIGLENVKWGALVTPDHDLTIPFTRMPAGPMDFTPGAMRNAAEKNFRPVFAEPMSQGTRCHQLAMYVVYESPLQMLCDSPSSYLREPEAMDFLSRVPVVWDETRVFEARMGDYLLLARRNGAEWYLAAMTDWTPRSFELKLDFLGEGDYGIEAWQDGPNAAKAARDFSRTTRTVTRSDSLKVVMAPGGGFAARIVPVRKSS